VVLLLLSLGLPPVFYLDQLRALRVPSVAILIAGVALALGLLARTVRLGDADLPRLPFWGGCAFMAGGWALDIGATLAHTPNLSQESNPVVRTLLESGHPLSLVYLVASLGQALFLLWACLALAAFLRHRRALVRSAWALEPRSPGEFVRAAMSGRRLTLRQFCFAVRAAELPRAYQFASLLNLCAAPLWASRWYLGLAWLDLVPQTPSGPYAAAAVAVVVVMLGYWAWLRRQYGAAAGRARDSGKDKGSQS
jgi:hypothetical protein